MINKILRGHFKFAAMLVLLISYGCFVNAVVTDGGKSFWLYLLFAMPLVVQLIGLWTLGSQFDPSNNGKVAFSWFYLTTVTVSSVFYCVLWCAYIYFGKTYDWENRAGWNTKLRP